MKVSRIAVVVSFVAGFAGAAFAAEEPRKINFTTALTDQDNAAITECADNPPAKEGAECKSRAPVTLGMLAMRALAAPEQGLSAEESLKRGQLALRVYKSEDSVLTVEEISLIKNRMAKVYGPLIVVRAFAILDPAATK